MNFNQLKYVAEVYKTKSFTRAANNLFIAQPSLSQQIKLLEEELGIVIFNRKKRKNIEITPCGKRVVEFALEIEKNINTFQTDLMHLKNTNYVELKVGLLWTFGYNHVSDFLNQFRDTYKEVKLLYKIEASKRLIRDFQKGDLDIIFITESDLPTNYGKHITMDLISSSRLNLILNKNHPLATKDYITLSDLHEENILMTSEQSFLYDELLEGFNKSKSIPNIIGQSSQVDIIMQIAENNIGMGFLAEESFKTYSGSKKSVCSIPIVPRYNRNIYMLTNKNSYYQEWVECFKRFIINLASLDMLENLEV
ncbi:LysR family transcriptional regulator [Enterococcus casseliflavus]|uniref:LysR family transcriptional regulator n=1 Tax=Enterococcus casseliflavus TaxID=37734 RepID=UPI0018CFBCAA|nr:LysR family transcriptional regulator [Enterococcus casseliflavus]